MPFGDEAATWVDNDLATVGEVTSIYCRPSLTRRTELQCLVRAKFICREAVMQLYNVEVLQDICSGTFEAKLVINLITAFGSHVCTYKIHRGIGVEGRFCVCSHFNC